MEVEFDLNMRACLRYLQRAETSINAGMAFAASCEARKAIEQIERAKYFLEAVALGTQKEADIKHRDALRLAKLANAIEVREL